MNRTLLTIVIVNWNTRILLSECLASIQAYSGRLDMAVIETIVVDNASDDGSADMVGRCFPWVRLIENERNVGFARANNQGIAAGRSPYVLLLNSDTLLHAGALDHLLDFMHRNRKVGAAGPRLLNQDGTLQASAHPMMTPVREFWRLIFLDRAWPRATYPMHRWDIATARPVQVLKGAAMMLRREALDQVGLLNEEYFMYSEEVDLCHKLFVGGWEIWYVPSAVITHINGASSRQMQERMFIELYRSKVHFFRQTGGSGRALFFKVLLLLAYLPRVLMRPKTKRFRRLLAELPQM